MAVRASRLLSAVTAGSVLAGTLLLGAGGASAAPAAPTRGGVVPATCGQSVTAYPGDTVKVTPKLGVPFLQTATPGMGPVAMTVGGLLCSVDVTVLVPVKRQLRQVAPPVAEVTEDVTEEVEKVVPKPKQTTPKAAPAPPLTLTPQQQAPTAGGASARSIPIAPESGLSPTELQSNAPLFAPAFTSGLPASFLSGAGAGAPSSAPVDSSTLFGSAFPGLSAGQPTYLGEDPASAVTTASQVQALPVSGMTDGLGIPAILAVLALSGVAAIAVRRMILGKGRPAAGAATSGSSLPAAPGAVPAEPEAAEATQVTALADAEATQVGEVGQVGEDAPSAAETTTVTGDAPTSLTDAVGPGSEEHAAEETRVDGIAPVDAAAAETAVDGIAPVDAAETEVDGIAPVTDDPAETGVIAADPRELVGSTRG